MRDIRDTRATHDIQVHPWRVEEMIFDIFALMFGMILNAAIISSCAAATPRRRSASRLPIASSPGHRVSQSPHHRVNSSPHHFDHAAVTPPPHHLHPSSRAVARSRARAACVAAAPRRCRRSTTWRSITRPSLTASSTTCASTTSRATSRPKSSRTTSTSRSTRNRARISRISLTCPSSCSSSCLLRSTAN